MVGTRPPATRRRSARFAHRYAATESSRRPAVGCIFAHDGPGRRSIEMSVAEGKGERMSWFAELRRRNVFRMAGLYLVGAWLLVQVAGTVLPMFGAPDWLPRSVVILLAIGFLPALIFSWVFEMTPEGLKCDDEVPIEQSIVPQIAEVYAYRNDKD